MEMCSTVFTWATAVLADVKKHWSLTLTLVSNIAIMPALTGLIINYTVYGAVWEQAR